MDATTANPSPARQGGGGILGSMTSGEAAESKGTSTGAGAGAGTATATGVIAFISMTLPTTSDKSVQPPATALPSSQSTISSSFMLAGAGAHGEFGNGSGANEGAMIADGPGQVAKPTNTKPIPVPVPGTLVAGRMIFLLPFPAPTLPLHSHNPTLPYHTPMIIEIKALLMAR